MASIPTKIGRYDIIELVGRGGMGVLYRAHDSMLERDVALKMMLVDFTLDPAARGRFEREAKAVARLQHRNVVTIHELGEAEGTPYIVMEFLGGRDLDSILKHETPLTLVQKLDIVIQLCDGLGYAHEQGIVHRDVKPGNVRVLDDGTVKILDFGIAKFAVSSMTQSGSILGTPSYMSPEQIMAQPVDGRADLFSAGVLLYELLASKKPFQGDAPTAVVYQIMHVEPPPLHEVVPDLPEPLLAVVSRALEKDPNNRYSRASEMASDLQMVKMMLDLPLNNPGGGPNPAIGDVTTRLYATTIREKTSPNVAKPALDAPMRSSAVAAAADAAPRQRAEHGSRGTILGVAALVVLGLVAAAFFMSRGGTTPPAGQPAASGASTAGRAGAPAAAASAGREGPLSVSSNPPGARISINGVDTGKTTTAKGVALTVKAGDELTLTLAGSEPLSAKVERSDLDTGTLTLNFAAKPAGPVRLVITGQYEFEVLMGGKILSPASTRHEFDVPASDKPVTVTARSTENLMSMPVTVDFKQRRVEKTVPELGFLRVLSVNETCSIVVDNQDVGFPPIVRKPVASGAHTVMLKCQDGKGAQQKVTISGGQQSEVKFGPPGG